MENFWKSKSKICTLEDLGKVVGINVDRTRERIAKRFLQSTGYDVDVDIIMSDEVQPVVEAWQIEVTRGFGKARVRMRQGGRGAWLTKPDEVPVEILDLVAADRRSHSEIYSSRSWEEWKRAKWANRSFKRHRSRSGVLNFSMDVRNIQRKTGKKFCRVMLKPLGLENADLVTGKCLTMPFAAKELFSAVNEMREQSQAALAAA